MTTCTTRAAETWAHILAQPDGYPMGIAADWLQEHDDHDGSAEAKAEACAAVEAVAQQHLDAHPDDHRARRLLGEWLEWHGDVRGEGYAALGMCKRVPREIDGSFYWYHLETERHHVETQSLKYPEDAVCPESDLPHQWRAGLVFEYPTRTAAEDAAALAFARLPAERRAQLKGEM